MTQPVETDRDAPCLVCGEAVGLAPTTCPVCETPHHFDCWEFGGGCGVYACRGRFRKDEAASAVPARAEAPGKLGMPVRRAGAYAGHLWCPPIASMVFFAAEAVAIPSYFAGEMQQFWVCLGIMAAAVAWIASTSVRFYVDFRERRISKAKALWGRDIWEWTVASLDQYQRLELRAPDRGEGLQVVAVPPVGDRVLELSPPLERSGEDLEAALDLFRRIEAAQAFPVQYPAALTGAGAEARGPRALPAGGGEAAPSGEA